MRKLSKKYVLVDEDLYERKFKSEARASKPHPYNPFTNPNVTAAKRNRAGLLKVANDETLDVNNASLLLQLLVQQYVENFSKSTTSRDVNSSSNNPEKLGRNGFKEAMWKGVKKAVAKLVRRLRRRRL